MRALSFTLTTSLLAITTAAFAANPPAPSASAVPMASPPGVTFETVNPQSMVDPGAAAANGMAAMGISAFVAKLVAYADPKGKTLYTFDTDPAGKSVCNAECATAWPPFTAPADAKADGDWSVVTRDDDSKQWALKGKPLYTFTKDERPGDGKGQNAAKAWHVAAFAPAARMQTPPGITAKETVMFDGQALVDANGMTLYTSDADKTNASSCVAACLKHWTPVEAPRVAAPIGDFASIGRADGGRQWAFKGKPLYTYTGDVRAGDANGANVDPQWHEVMLVRYYRPSEVTVTIHPKHGAMLTTANGMTLYARDAHRFTLAGGAHDDRSAMRGAPATGRRIGTKGCTDECLQEWVPFKAPANAVTTNLWSVVDRPDGTKQWAYNGYPLYTFTGDKQPGAALGHDMYQMTDGTTGLFWRVALP